MRSEQLFPLKPVLGAGQTSGNGLGDAWSPGTYIPGRETRRRRTQASVSSAPGDCKLLEGGSHFWRTQKEPNNRKVFEKSYCTDSFPGEICKFRWVRRSWAHFTLLTPGLRLHRHQAARLFPALKPLPLLSEGNIKGWDKRSESKEFWNVKVIWFLDLFLPKIFLWYTWK